MVHPRRHPDQSVHAERHPTPGPVIGDTNRVNRGWALFATNEDLDDYVLVDFVEYRRSVAKLVDQGSVKKTLILLAI